MCSAAQSAAGRACFPASTRPRSFEGTGRQQSKMTSGNQTAAGHGMRPSVIFASAKS